MTIVIRDLIYLAAYGIRCLWRRQPYEVIRKDRPLMQNLILRDGRVVLSGNARIRHVWFVGDHSGVTMEEPTDGWAVDPGSA